MSKISQYAAITSVQGDDLLAVVDVHDTSMAPTGTDKKMTLSQLPFDASGAAAAAQAASVPLADLPLAISNGGTGQAGQQAALDALAGTVTSGQVLRGNGTHVQMSAIQAGDVPQLSQYNPVGLTGATAPTSYAGGTVSGHPLSGTWSQGQWVVDQAGHIYVCVAGGTPGTWRRVGAMPYQFFLDDYCKGDGKQALVTVVNGNATINTTPLAAPSAPTLSNSGSGGSLTAGTYQAEMTYVNRWGETVASSSTSVGISGTQPLTITAPALSGNATGWYAYVTQAGGSTYYRQQTAGSPTAMGVSLVLTANPTTSGANPPGADSSAAQVFAASDTGKNIMICGGLGFGTPWIDTIATYNSPTSVTLSTAGASTSQSGCAMVCSTDDRFNVDQCISDATAYALANNNFCQVIGSDRNYGLGTGLFQSLSTTGTYTRNSQVRVPDGNPSGQTEKLEFQLLGPGDSTHNEFWVSQYVNLNGCTFISYSLGPTTADPTYGQQSVIGAPLGGVNANGSNGFANVKAVIKGIQVVVPGWNNSIGIDLQDIGCLVRASAMAFAPATNTGGGVNPANAWITNSFFQSKLGTGLRLPNALNNDDVRVESFAAGGVTTSLITEADHVVIDRLATINADLAVKLIAGSGVHALTIGQWSFENIGGALEVIGGTAPLMVDITMDGENASVSYDISDSNSALTGVIRWNDTFRPAVNGIVAPTVIGGANVEIINGALTRSVQSAPTYTLGTALQNPWWRHMTITLAGGTVSGISIGPTSGALTSLGITSGTFRLPSGWWLDIAGSVKPTTFIAVPD